MNAHLRCSIQPQPLFSTRSFGEATRERKKFGVEEAQSPQKKFFLAPFSTLFWQLPNSAGGIFLQMSLWRGRSGDLSIDLDADFASAPANVSSETNKGGRRTFFFNLKQPIFFLGKFCLESSYPQKSAYRSKFQHVLNSSSCSSTDNGGCREIFLRLVDNFAHAATAVDSAKNSKKQLIFSRLN